MLPGIWKVESIAERAKALEAAEAASRTTKVAKVYFIADNLWVSVEVSLADEDGFESVFWRCVDVLDLARNRVIEALQEPAG